MIHVGVYQILQIRKGDKGADLLNSHTSVVILYSRIKAIDPVFTFDLSYSDYTRDALTNHNPTTFKK